MAHIFFKTPVPKNILEEAYAQKEVINVSTSIIEQWNPSKSSALNSKLFEKKMIYQLIISKKEKLQFLLLSLRPSEKDYMFIDLPKPLHFLYFIFRGFDQLKKYFVQKK